MSKITKYLLISLPTSIVPSHHRDDALDAISATISPDNGTVSSFSIPEFKIGTLDALVQQADELAKLESLCQNVVGKVGDALKSILDGDETQIANMKTVNDSMHTPDLMRNLMYHFFFLLLLTSCFCRAEPVDQYLRSFSWNKVKYRADKSVGELIDLLQKVQRYFS
jgi:V-type H+-transporting ATPase subunit C